MLQFSIQVDDDAEPQIRAFISALSGAARTPLNQAAVAATALYCRTYHTQYDADGEWRGPRTFGTGTSDFGSRVAAAWFERKADPDGGEIYNNAPHFRHKVFGGTIRPKRAKYLTIPLVKEAHGKAVKTYQQDNRKRLFRIPGRNALFEKVDGAAPSGKGAKAKIRPVYALVKEVVQKPWPRALPPEDKIAQAFKSGWLDALDDHLASI